MGYLLSELLDIEVDADVAPGVGLGLGDRICGVREARVTFDAEFSSQVAAPAASVGLVPNKPYFSEAGWSSMVGCLYDSPDPNDQSGSLI